MAIGDNSFKDSLPSLETNNLQYNKRRITSTTTGKANVIKVLSDMAARSIGEVAFQIRRDDNTKYQGTASPMNPFMYAVPLPNESIQVVKDNKNNEWYYTGIYPKGAMVNYLPTADLITRSETEEEGKFIPFTGDYFVPHPYSTRMVDTLEGDVVIQGRFGQSIRMSHTNPGIDTPWKKGTREETTPIIIIRNGYTPIENFEFDDSAIWLTTDQHITLPLKAPLPPDIESTKNTYGKSQVILWSDRLVLGSRIDEILLSSNTSIHFCTQNWTHDVDVVLDTVDKLITQVKSLAKIIKDVSFTSMLQTFIIPGFGTTATSTRVGDFSTKYSEAVTAEQQILQLQNSLELLKQKS